VKVADALEALDTIAHRAEHRANQAESDRDCESQRADHAEAALAKGN
jgi:hypothetical protein